MRGERRPTALWSHKDRLLALALAVYEADLCAGCGHPMSESMDPANERRYHAPPPHRCHACTAIELRSAEYEKAQQPRALRFTVDLIRRVASVAGPSAP